MDYFRRFQLMYLAPSILIVVGSSVALMDRLNENFPEHLFPHYWNPHELTSCDFESPCSWTLSNHSRGGDWLVTSPGEHMVDSQRAEPLTDHSVGSSGGHFLLLEAAGAERSGSCRFFLVSPMLFSSGVECQLQLARYQTRGARGNLTVQVKPLDSDSPVSSVSLTNRGPDAVRGQWELLKAHIGRQEEPFQVMLLYSVCGEDSWSRLAIDSLQLNDCEADVPVSGCSEGLFRCHSDVCVDQSRVCDFHYDCPFGEDEGPVCDSLPLGSWCSFESGPCGWTASADTGSWTLLSGQELGADDVLGSTLRNTEGRFLFLTTKDRPAGGSAVVQSPPLPALVESGMCLVHFHLYLYGTFNGTVLLSVDTNSTAGAPLVWQSTGEGMDGWKDVTLRLSDVFSRFHLRVEVHWGPNSRANVALDNITLGASCFETDHNSVRLNHRVLHEIDSEGDLDFLSPLPEPSASEVPYDTWWFTSCGASGPQGPTQAQCDSAYRNSNVSVTVGKEGALKGVQMWRVPATNHYIISAYGAAGGKGAKNHNKRSNGVFISATFHLQKGETLYILVGHQGEDACPGRNLLTQKICLGESSVIEDGLRGGRMAGEWAGGGGGGGGATYIYREEDGVLVPLVIAAGGGGKAYMEDPEDNMDHIFLEQYENNTEAAGTNGKTGAAGGGGGWGDTSTSPWAGKSLLEGAEGGASCSQALEKLDWATFGGFGGGGGACTAGGGGGGYRGGDAAPDDDITAGGQEGISFIHPSGEIFLPPLAAMESHGEAEIKVQLNCTHCQSQSCRRDEDTKLYLCLCQNGKVLADDNVTCIAPRGPAPEGHFSLPLILAVVASTMVTGVVLTCTSLALIYYRKKNRLHAVRIRLQSPEYKLSKIRTSTIMTDYNPNYCFAGKVASLSELKEVPRKNIILLRALGHGAFGEVYEGQVLGFGGDNVPLQVAIKTLPEISSEQDEMDFLMEALIMSKFSHQNIVRCVGVSLQTLPRFILLELMTGGDMKTFLRQNRPKPNKASSLSMLDLLHMARDIAFGCRYLEENHFIHRDIAARNCLLTCSGSARVAKIGDFGMARDIYRASYYRKGGRAMLPVKWMPPEAFLEGIFTCKTDTWSFGVLLWEIFSLGYMPYPCKTNQEVLEFVTSGGRMDPPKSCPGPVYRIMTQCWQHCPEHRPNFSTILERINYCTQDPDVINTPLPVECGPHVEQEVDAVRPRDGSSGTPPLLSPSSLNLEGSPEPCSVSPLPQAHKSCPPSQPPQQLQEAAPGKGTAEAEPATTSAGSPGSWLHPDQQMTVSGSSSGSQRLKNKTKNLWNPTYGSWGPENIGRGKQALSHTRSVPLSNSPIGLLAASAHEREDSGFDGNASSSPASSHASPSSSSTPSPPPPSSPNAASNMAFRKNTGVALQSSTAGVDLARLQSFPCGNVNYAYDEPSYEGEKVPLVVAKILVAGSDPAPSASGTELACSVLGIPKSLAKRHASYGHEDIKRNALPEKPTRDRDSGLSLSEDLTVTSV